MHTFTGWRQPRIMRLLKLERLAFMGDSAPDTRNSPLAIEGMESLFEGSVPGSISQKQSEEPGSESIDTRAIEVVSTEEAARRLGISSRAVIKRLKNGSLRGFRDDSKQRAEWRIYWNEPSSEPKGTSSFEGTQSGTRERTGSSNGTGSQESYGTGSLSYLMELNKQLLEQVQALTYRNGYLESQLSEREKDITERDEKMRLLTDSQHKRGSWLRFWSWFTGQKETKHV